MGHDLYNNASSQHGLVSNIVKGTSDHTNVSFTVNLKVCKKKKNLSDKLMYIYRKGKLWTIRKLLADTDWSVEEHKTDVSE